MAIIYSYPETLELLPTDMLIGTSTIKVAGKRKNITKNFTLELLKDFILDGLPAVQWGSITGTLSNQTDLQTALNNKQNNITLTTTGTSGAATLVGSTLNIPNYSSVTYSFTSPLVNTSGVVSITQSNATTDGYLSSTDWNTFNSKQTALSGTGFVKISGTTISYDNTTYYPYPTGTISEYVRGDGSLATFPTATVPTLNQVLTAGNTSLLDAKIGDLYLYDPTEFDYGYLSLNDSDFSFSDVFGQAAIIARSGIVLSGTPGGFYGNILLPSVTNNRTYTLPDASGTIALTSDIPTAVTSVGATSPITSSGGTTPTISTSMSTNKLIGRSTAGTGVMEEITVGTGLTLSAGTLSATSTGGSIPHATASGTDTYTATVTGVSSYADADAYLIRFTNGNTTGATLDINGLGAIPLYENNNGPLIGGDIWDNGEMLCVYNATLNIFQCIGTSSNSLFAYVTNADTVPITKGEPVYAFGGTGDRLTVKRAFNTSDAGSARTIGVVLSSSIGVNQKGFIIIEGLLDGLSILPTATWSDGDTVYLGTTAGSITNVKQYAPNHLVYLGTVTTASNGSSGRWYVKVQNGYELDELHNVQAQSPSLNDTLWYDSTVTPGQWKTASIPTILGYTPVTNARTISTTSPLQGGGDLTADRTLSILQSSAIQNGYLSSTDWSTFNSKFTLPSLTNGSVLFSNGTTIAEDNANFFWDDTNNRLGLGTTSPSSRLHVDGSMYLQDSNTGIESITFSQGPQIVSDGPSGYFRTGQVYTNTITSNVGIGTSSPTDPLTVYGDIKFGTATGAVETIRSAAGGSLLSYSPILSTVNIASSNLVIDTVNSVISTPNSVGIGTATPATALDVNGIITATGGNSTSWNAKQDAITLTTTGTSGPATLIGTTLNIPEYSGGGGGGGNVLATHVLAKPRSGFYYGTGMVANLNVTNTTNGTLILSAFTPAYNLTVSELVMQVTTLLVGGLIKTVIYSDLNGVPNTKLFESATATTDTTGLKTITGFSFTFNAGQTYWISIIANGTVGVRSLNPGTTNIAPLIANSSSTQFYQSWFISTTFASPATTLPTPTVGNLNGGQIPYVVFRAT